MKARSQEEEKSRKRVLNKEQNILEVEEDEMSECEVIEEMSFLPLRWKMEWQSANQSEVGNVLFLSNEFSVFNKTEGYRL